MTTLVRDYIDLSRFGVTDASTLHASLSAIVAWRPQAVMVGADPLTHTYRSKIIASLAKTRVPAMFCYSQVALDGGLMSYS